MRVISIALTASILVLWAHSSATAQNRSRDTHRPWAAGVSAVNQKRSLSLYKEGNRLMERSRYVQAQSRYEVAVGHWDHPMIRYNTAVALIPRSALALYRWHNLY